MAEKAETRASLRKELVETLSAELLADAKAELERYITHPKGLIFDDLNRTQRHWHRTPNPQSIFDVGLSPLSTTLDVERDLKTGALLGFHEVEISHVGATAKSSTSLKRAPGNPIDGIKGNSSNLPFWPGGMEESTIDDLLNVDSFEEIDFEHNLLKVPPGFEFGMDFDDSDCTEASEGQFLDESINEINLAKLLLDAEDDICLGLTSSEQKEDVSEPLPQEENPIRDECDEILEASAAKEKQEVASELLRARIQTALKKERIPKLKMSSPVDVLAISKEVDPNDIALAKTEWAEVVNVNKAVDDFEAKVPLPAHTWPFELDTFQKQAILHLEKQESVFVAAHTSAGKTVVAEYAIALSMKHLTKTVYTSPIKALSNQKFREFKKTFQDVGLITGDIQLSPESACLIMTTEILRSMLYNGSDTIRDLEWVIFDEVHYINDNERGVVWEEVLILLPKHVNIVLLSATVPNALEFADWIGRTKKQVIYVISTPKRPVPLEHYLYIGTSVKAQNELYMIVGADGKSRIAGYNAAKDAHTGFKKDQGGGGKPGSSSYNAPHLTLKQERNIWLNVLHLLKKKDQLPVVVFTFSRKLCDQNAQMLTSVDLTSASEKNKIREFTSRCMQRLKNDDRNIPQVKSMQELLVRGIGIHHSGILPILKEVVEMLFQEGVVKLLFATETFAMGVNMPARTVVFDSITKFDGIQRRALRPEEYIQMAGRAGRRGLDLRGMAIILCKNQFLERSNLEIMIQGKPTVLESRFRLTYAMILNLLRVEKLPVSEMMKRSFSEIGMQKKASHHEKRLKSLTERESALTEVDCALCRSSLDAYYDTCQEYVHRSKALLKSVLSQPSSAKALCPGRVLVVGKQEASLGIILKTTKSTSNQNPGPVLHVLVGNESEAVKGLPSGERSRANSDALLVHLLNARRANLNPLGAALEYDVVKCDIEDVVRLVADVVPMDGDKVFKDWDKRQIPRFKDDPPSASFVAAAQELAARLRMSGDSLSELDPRRDLNIKDVDVCDEWINLKRLHERLDEYLCITCIAFEDHFKTLHTNRKLQSELREVKHLLSDESLKLRPEYMARIEVLKALRYIDNLETVLLKGRVACEISNHELVTTELVFENVLTGFQPAEIAALLSCMVCQEKRHKDGEEPTLTHALTQGKERILTIVRNVDKLQKKHGIVEEKFEEQYRFELAEVVYEWARGMPFAEIMNLTEIQEGIIVRCIQRLDEILRDVKDAARMVGDPALYQKMDAASQAIKRDIVFAASLYTQ